jgi:hypothetical protein
VTNVDDPERLKALTEAVQDAGQQLYAAAILICGEGVEPEIVLFGEDFANGQQTIEMKEPD